MAAVTFAPSAQVFPDLLRAVVSSDSPPPPPPRGVVTYYPTPAQAAETIMVARPLLEMVAHISHRMLPSWQLIARCIKVIALALFRRHFCDHVFLVTGLQREQRIESTTPGWTDLRWENMTGVAYSFRGRITESRVSLFQAMYPFMFEEAIELRLNSSLQRPSGSGPLFFANDVPINAQTIRQEWFRTYGIRLTDKEEGNTVRDLLKSRHLERLNS